MLTQPSTSGCSQQIDWLRQALREENAMVIGAGAGLSASAGMTYSEESFQKYFSDFREKYGIRDMYSGGFYPFRTPEELWAWWIRLVLVNRYEREPRPVTTTCWSW